MTTALTPIGKVVTHMLRGDQAYATKDIEWANPSKPYSGAIYSAEAVESLRKRIEALEAELAKLRDSECDKIMAMSEEQINALTRMQGSNPDDAAKIGRMACDLALKDVANQRLEAELAVCKRDALWNKRIISSVDRLLEIAGYQPDCSIRNSLACMRFDAAMAAQEKA